MLQNDEAVWKGQDSKIDLPSLDNRRRIERGYLQADHKDICWMLRDWRFACAFRSWGYGDIQKEVRKVWLEEDSRWFLANQYRCESAKPYWHQFCLQWVLTFKCEDCGDVHCRGILEHFWKVETIARLTRLSSQRARADQDFKEPQSERKEMNHYSFLHWRSHLQWDQHHQVFEQALRQTFCGDDYWDDKRE